MRPLDRPVLVRPPTVVPRRRHPVVLAHQPVTPGQVLAVPAGHVPERRRQTVRPELPRRPAQLLQRVLQPLRQRGEALASHDDMRVGKPRPRQPEVEQPVRQPLPLHPNSQLVHRGEVRKPLPPRLRNLPEPHLLLRPVLRAPRPDPPLQRPPNPTIQLRMGSHQLLEHRDRPNPRTRLQQRNHLRLEHPRQRVRSATTPPLPLRAPLLQHPVPTRPAEPGPRRSRRDRTPLSLRHEDPPLLIGDVTARHRSPPAGGRASADPDLDPRGNPGSRASAPPDRLRLQRRSRHLPTPDERPTPSHPVCRACLTQIDAPHLQAARERVSGPEAEAERLRAAEGIRRLRFQVPENGTTLDILRNLRY